MGMDMPRCKTPETVRKEIGMSVSVRKCATLSAQWGPPEWLRRESLEGVFSDG
jgi:hypothetical protein